MLIWIDSELPLLISDSQIQSPRFGFQTPVHTVPGFVAKINAGENRRNAGRVYAASP